MKVIINTCIQQYHCMCCMHPLALHYIIICIGPLVRLLEGLHSRPVSAGASRGQRSSSQASQTDDIIAEGKATIGACTVCVAVSCIELLQCCRLVYVFAVS